LQYWSRRVLQRLDIPMEQQLQGLERLELASSIYDHWIWLHVCSGYVTRRFIASSSQFENTCHTRFVFLQRGLE
jgi:hypothetical protein